MNKKERHRAKIAKRARVQTLARNMTINFSQWYNQKESLAGTEWKKSEARVREAVALWLFEKLPALGSKKAASMAASIARVGSTGARINVNMDDLARRIIHEENNDAT